MKKVFHIISKLDIGGAERVAISIAKCKRCDVEQHIVELMRGRSDATRNIIEELEQNGIHYHRSHLPVFLEFHYVIQKLIALLFPLRFLFLWLRYRPDVIHCHTEMPDLAIWLSLRLMPFVKIKVVKTIHNNVLWHGMDRVGRNVENYMQEHHTVVAISENVRASYQAKYGGNDIPVIHNGISPVRQEKYEGIVNGKTNICFAGRLEHEKGITTLCDIVMRLKDDMRYHFHIFGTGRMQEDIDRLKTLPNVSVNPPVNGISKYIGSFDYIIMPSLFEGLSIFALEASFNGAPMIINKCNGLSDTLPEDWPLTVHDNDIDQWIDIFKHRLPAANHELLQEKAFDHVKKFFSMKKMQDKYIQVYLQ